MVFGKLVWSGWTLWRRTGASLIECAKKQNNEKSEAERSKHWQRRQLADSWSSIGTIACDLGIRGPDRQETARAEAKGC
jgi:hypothetical protein